jgi:hypothetical protein
MNRRKRPLDVRAGDEDPAPDRGVEGQLPELIMPAPTVTPVTSSMRMNEPV